MGLSPCLGTFEAKTFKYDLEHSRGDWLGNLANIKVENSGAVGYVGSFLMTVHTPLVSLYYKL